MNLINFHVSINKKLYNITLASKNDINIFVDKRYKKYGQYFTIIVHKKIAIDTYMKLKI